MNLAALYSTASASLTHRFLKQVATFTLVLVSLTGCVPPFSQQDPAEFREGVNEFTVEGIRYVTAGNPEKPLVLFLHGTPGSWHAFKHQLYDQKLQEAAHLIALDRPGFGASKQTGVAPSFASQVDLLAPALALNRSGKPCIIVGHSLGGSIAYRFAIDAPEKVGGIVVISSNIAPELGKPRWFNRIAALPGFRSVLPDQLGLANDEIKPLQAELQAMQDKLSEIRAMVTVLHGAKDSLVSVHNLTFIEQKIVNSRSLRVIREESVGHFLIWEKPLLVRDAILDQVRMMKKINTGVGD